MDGLRERSWACGGPDKVIHMLKSHSIPYGWKRRLAKGRCYAIAVVRLAKRSHIQSKFWTSGQV